MMDHFLDKYKNKLAELAREQPDVLLHTVKAAMAALALQHGALLIQGMSNVDEAIDCGCDDCKLIIRRGVGALQIIESDRMRIEAAMGLITEVKDYKKPPDEMLDEVLNKLYTEFQRQILERAVKQENSQ